MPISKESLKGYILEEALAYLIRNAGYRIIVDEREDPDELENVAAGLAVIGRGAKHQADVLGQLQWIPAFTFPLRLFVEAKFRGNTVALPTVRNAVGVLLDINQKNLLSRRGQPVQRYQYAYAIFSMSGFSSQAQEMAKAHQISLIDLSGVEYTDLANAIDVAAETITPSDRRGSTVYNVRQAIREGLGTPLLNGTGRSHESYNPEFVARLKNDLNPVFKTVQEYRELFVGMANGPFMLLLKANNPLGFIEYMKQHPRQRVIISWNSHYEDGKVWTVRFPENSELNLEFRLPRVLDEWIFQSYLQRRERALDAKREYLSNITIWYHEENADRLFTLEYDPTRTNDWVNEHNRLR